MKKILLLSCIIMIFCLTGCFSKKEELVCDEFYIKQDKDTKEITIGDTKIYPDNQAVFVPYYVSNYVVTNFGYSSAWFGGNGYFFNAMSGNKRIERFYAPSSINNIMHGYMKLAQTNALKVFYCGEILNVGRFDLQERDFEVYVPINEYEEFLTASESFSGKLNKANFVYDINYDGDCYKNHYYYIDYVNNDEKVEYIPPTPTREGYNFGGWFKDTECSIEWKFDEDVVTVKDGNEIRVYAKWDKK